MPIKLHMIKSWPEHFQPVLDGEKGFEIRLNDRDYKIGDHIELREFVPAHRPETQQQGYFTGRVSPMQVITYITALAPTKFVVLGIRAASMLDPVVAPTDRRHGTFDLRGVRRPTSVIADMMQSHEGVAIREVESLEPILTDSEIAEAGLALREGRSGSLDAGVPSDVDLEIKPVPPGPWIDPRQRGAEPGDLTSEQITAALRQQPYRATGRYLTLHERELLEVLVEEACELGQAACKLLRFGVGEIGPGHDVPNHLELALECGDVRHMIQRCVDAGLFAWGTVQDGEERKERRLAIYLQNRGGSADAA